MAELAPHIGRHALIELAGGLQISGLVYAVDPEGGSAIVCTPVAGGAPTAGGGQRVKPRVVFAHAVRRVTAVAPVSLSDLSDMYLQRVGAADGKAESVPKATEIDARLRQLCKLLDEHQLPFAKLNGTGACHPTIELFGSLRIEPPYGPHTCTCENELVLTRIRTLLQPLDAAGSPAAMDGRAG
jgi:hypothetical protein